MVQSGCSCHQQRESDSAGLQAPPSVASTVHPAHGTQPEPDRLATEPAGFSGAGFSGDSALRASRHKLLYTVQFMCGGQAQDPCDCVSVRPGRYSTAVTLYNATSQQLRVQKWVIPTLLAGAPIGREPRVTLPRAKDELLLPARSATLIDCCGIVASLLGGPASGSLHAGLLQLTADGKLAVSVVHTAQGTDGGAPSLDVKQLVGRPI